MVKPTLQTIQIKYLPIPDIFNKAKTQLCEVATKPDLYLSFSHRFFFVARYAAVLWEKEDSQQWQDILAGKKNGQSGIHEGCEALNVAASNVGKKGDEFENQAFK